jgi:membrane protein DedA with SNARE-associated domain
MLAPERRHRLQRKFHDHGIKLLVVARLLPPLRTGVFLIAGTLHYPFLLFVAADAIVAVLGVGLLFFCSAWLIDLIHQLSNTIIWIAVPLVVFVLYRYYRFLSMREMRGVPIPPVTVLALPLKPADPPPDTSKSEHRASPTSSA